MLKKILPTILLAGTFLVFSALPAMALSLPQLVPQCASTSGSVGGKPPDPPQLDCVFQLGANIAQIILALTGSIALLMFVIGGFFMLASGGNDELVKKGREFIKNAVIGLVIILLSGMVLSFGINALTTSQNIIGQSCPVNGKTGSLVQLPGKAKLKCAAICQDLIPENYSCTTPGATNGVYQQYCLPISGCTGGQVCCYTAP